MPKQGKQTVFGARAKGSPYAQALPRAPLPRADGMRRAHRKYDTKISIPQKMPVAQGFFAECRGMSGCRFRFFAEYPAGAFAFSQNAQPAFRGISGRRRFSVLFTFFKPRTSCRHRTLFAKPSLPFITFCIKSTRFYAGNLTLCIHFAIIYGKVVFRKCLKGKSLYTVSDI